MHERGQNQELGKTTESLVDRQKAAAKIDFYLGLQQTFGGIAKSAIDVENLPHGQRRAKQKRLTNALLDLYLIKSNNLIEEPFYDRYTDISSQCEEILDQYMPELQEIEALYDNNSGDYDGKKRMKIALQVSHRFKKLSITQREQIIEASGYEPKQSVDIVRKLTKSGAITGVLAPLSAAVVASGSAYEREFPLVHLGSLDNNVARFAIAASYFFQYGMAYAYSRTNQALLENEEIGNAPDIFPSVLYMLSKRFLPEAHFGSHDIDMTKFSTLVGTILPIAVQEPGVIASMLLFGPQVVFARNMIGGVITGAQAVGFKHSKKAQNYLS